MDSGQDSQDVGRHRLGPHVVGQRVVVRRIVRGETGPTGGPAFTDVLGVCTSWGAATCVVTPASGEPVTIAIGDIVSGKPVPPRPSVRHRVPARDAERHAAVLWPQVERLPLGEWELRSDPTPGGRSLKRTNSCLAMGEPGVPLPTAEEAVRSFYAGRSRGALVQVEQGSGNEEAFTAGGWITITGGDSHFQIASLARTARLLRSFPGSEERGSQPTRLVDGPRVEVRMTLDGRTVAVARAGLSGDWVGVHGLEVDPDHRRRGLARQLLAEIIEWGGEQGAATVWLHVEVDNAPALALNESLGFLTHHSLRYLRPA